MHALQGHELRDRFLKNEVSAEKIASYFLKRAEKADEKLFSFLNIRHEKVLEKAYHLDKKRKEGRPCGKLASIPIAIKDNIHIEGEITTCASNSLKDYRSPFSASVVKLLEKEDALILGKTNLDELAMGSSTETSAFFPTKNPWNLLCSPGGSSGGSAAAVSARSVLMALGTDTGGSIRQPASLSGILGLKPTYGRISRYGVAPFASSLDHVGPMTSSAKDMALICEVLFNYCPSDPTSLKQSPFSAFSSLYKSIHGIKIGVPWKFLKNLTEKSATSFNEALKVLESLGAAVHEVDIPELKFSVAAYHVIAPLEGFSNLAKIGSFHQGPLETGFKKARGEGLGLEVKKRMLLGAHLLSHPSYYEKALSAKKLLLWRFQKLFESCDLIALPSSPSTAFQLHSHKDPMDGYLQDLYTIASNLTHHPSLSIPCGLDETHLPFGLQLIAPHLQEENLLRAAFQFEQIIKLPIPPLFEGEN